MVLSAILVGAGCAAEDPAPPSVGIKLPDGTVCQDNETCDFNVFDSIVGVTRSIGLTVFNEGDAPAELTDLTLEGDPSFELVEDLGTRLAAHDQEAFVVTWTPQAVGVASSELVLSWRPPVHAVSLRLFGRAQGPG